YTPFYATKLTETTQLLVLTVLGFWLWKKYLAPKPCTMLDLDWWYRVAPVKLAAKLAEVGSDETAESRTEHGPQPAGSGEGLSVPAITPTWIMGTVVGAAAVLIVIASVLR